MRNVVALAPDIKSHPDKGALARLVKCSRQFLHAIGNERFTEINEGLYDRLEGATGGPVRISELDWEVTLSKHRRGAGDTGTQATPFIKAVARIRLVFDLQPKILRCSFWPGDPRPDFMMPADLAWGWTPCYSQCHGHQFQDNEKVFELKDEDSIPQKPLVYCFKDVARGSLSDNIMRKHPGPIFSVTVMKIIPGCKAHQAFTVRFPTNQLNLKIVIDKNLRDDVRRIDFTDLPQGPPPWPYPDGPFPTKTGGAQWITHALGIAENTKFGVSLHWNNPKYVVNMWEEIRHPQDKRKGGDK